MKKYAAMTLLFLFVSPVNAQTIEPQRLTSILKEIRCVVCQNQNLAESNAPLAKDLRVKIEQMVQENKTDAEIKNYLVKRYGEFILLKPRLNNMTLLLWFAPIIILVIMITILKFSIT